MNPHPANEEVENENSPEAEISLNPEAARVQYQSQAQAVIEAAVEFIRWQGSSTTTIVNVTAYKALREQVHGFNVIAYELQLTDMLVRLGKATGQQSAGDPSPDSTTPAGELPGDEGPPEN